MNSIISMFLILLWAQWSIGQQTICYGSVEHYGVDMEEGSGMGTPDSFYAWTIIGNRFAGEIIIPDSGNTNEIIVDWGETPPGNYVVLVEEINNGCFGEQQQLDVTVLAVPEFDLAPSFICREPTTSKVLDRARLQTGLPESLFSFTWYFEDEILPYSRASIAVDQIGTYSVKVTNKQSGCQILDSTTVEFSSPAIANIRVQQDFDDTQRISIDVLQGMGDYEFALDNGDFQDRPEFLVTEAGAYTVTIRDKRGCGETGLVANVLTFPKFFSPNNDGFNDFWNIDGAQPIMEANISIYDRYGNLITQIDGQEKGWDGTADGKPLPSDDYWFVVDYINAFEMDAVFKSHFTLKR